jgi:hypothetical protein
VIVSDQKVEMNWQSTEADVAWFDKPNARALLDEKIATGVVSEDDREFLEGWIDQGFAIAKNSINHSDIDELNGFVDRLWSSETDMEVDLLGFTPSKGEPSRTVHHRELLDKNREQRMELASLSPWRIHELWTKCDAAKRIFRSPVLNHYASLIFQKYAYARSSINFAFGSQQELHQDMAVFHVFPGNYLIGVWIALEDISEESGPLIISPASHRSSLWPGFNNYPQTNLRTCSLASYASYYEFTNRIAGEFGTEPFLAKKGDVLFWHGQLVHGGSPVQVPGRSRRSMVIHYMTEGVDQTKHIEGPFNWS